MSTIAVSGGAGYLGRSISEVLLQEGHRPICLDNYSTSHPFHDDRIPCFEVDLADAKAVREVWKKLPEISGILHFAARALVPESNEKPGEYFRNNLFSTLSLAEIASERNIPFIHSSSCAVYGIPEKVPITEQTPPCPISPYGETKRASEEILRQFSRTQGLRALNLRYFNPGGAIEGVGHGEAHEPETHLIPNVLKAGLEGRAVDVFGTDYPTPDGSCIRDFIHVKDLATGHIRALEYVTRQSPGFWDAINLGSGEGSSVLQVIAAAEKALGRPVEKNLRERRPGDPPILVASIEQATRKLGWRPTLGLDAILASHLAWESRRSRA